MAPYSDFIKFIAYHDVLWPRIRHWYLGRFQKTILGELTLPQILRGRACRLQISRWRGTSQ